MAENTLRCANCGESLPSPDAICPRCERELSVDLPKHEPLIDPSIGKYRCPNCSSRFDWPIFAWWPPHAKWYLPQESKPQCPHCRVFLRDKMVTAFIRWRVLIIVFIMIFFAPPNLGIRIILLVSLLVLFHLLHIRKVRVTIPIEEERYTVEKLNYYSKHDVYS